MKGGGYKFETASEENAKTGVRNALRTSSSIFHRLPNGHYGLLSWYPSAKAPDENGAIRSSRTSKGRLQNNQVTNEEVRDLILGQPAQFTTGDIISAVKSKLPSKELPPNKVGSLLFILKSKGIIREVSKRVGKTQAVYAKT